MERALAYENYYRCCSVHEPGCMSLQESVWGPASLSRFGALSSPPRARRYCAPPPPPPSSVPVWLAMTAPFVCLRPLDIPGAANAVAE